jgi:hypothetical protein
MNNDAFIVPTGLVKDIPGFPKLFCMIAAYYMEHVVECEDGANVEKKEGKSGWRGKTIRRTRVPMLTIANKSLLL